MTNLEISIILPLYNQTEELLLVLEGYEKQCANVPFEVIVVDDGSSQSITALENKISSCNLNIKLIKQENKGRSAARNTGINESIGNLLIFNDSDRIPGPNYVEAHKNAHRNLNDSNIIVMGMPKELYIPRTNSEMIKRIWRSVTEVEEAKHIPKITKFTNSVLKIYDQKGNTDSGIAYISTFSGNMSLRRETIDEKLFDEKFNFWGVENIELGYRLYQAGVVFKHEPRAINYHLAHSRGAGFYESGINKSYNYLYEKYGQSSILTICEFVLGKISLQDLEKMAGNRNSEWLKTIDVDIYNKFIE